MIDELKHQIGPDVTNALRGALGVSMTGTGVGDWIGWIDIASSFLGFLLAMAGLVLTIFTIISTSHTMKQSRIKTETDQLNLDKARKDFDSISN